MIDLKELTRHLEVEIVTAPTEAELHEALSKFDSKEWTPLRAPFWVNDYLVMVLIKPMTAM